jgi:hypothetical protein
MGDVRRPRAESDTSRVAGRHQSLGIFAREVYLSLVRDHMRENCRNRSLSAVTKSIFDGRRLAILPRVLGGQ